MSDTVFTKILSGDIPSHRVYEDEHVYAFLDIGPLSRGHTLVIPKEPAETIDKLSAESSAAIGRVLPAITRAVMAATGCSACNILQNNGERAHQAVMHVHFHVIPKAEDGSGLDLTWRPTDIDHADAKELAERIAGAVKGN
ncbi:MAG: HIT family protein [Planctomycetota bacterium]